MHEAAEGQEKKPEQVHRGPFLELWIVCMVLAWGIYSSRWAVNQWRWVSFPPPSCWCAIFLWFPRSYRFSLPPADHTPCPGSQGHKERQWMVQGLSASRPRFCQNDSKGPPGSVCASGQPEAGPGSPRTTWKKNTWKSIGLCSAPTFVWFLGELSFSRLSLYSLGAGLRNHLLGASSPPYVYLQWWE